MNQKEKRAQRIREADVAVEVASAKLATYRTVEPHTPLYQLKRDLLAFADAQIESITAHNPGRTGAGYNSEVQFAIEQLMMVRQQLI